MYDTEWSVLLERLVPALPEVLGLDSGLSCSES